MISPLTERFRKQELLKDSQIGSRYESLFQNNGQADFDIRRQSFLESMVRLSSRRMQVGLESVRTGRQTLGDDLMLQAFQEWTTSFDAMHESETLEMPAGFLNAVWNVYKETMKDPSYFFFVFMFCCYLLAFRE